MFRPSGILGKKRSAVVRPGQALSEKTLGEEIALKSEELAAALGQKGTNPGGKSRILLEVEDLHKDFGGLKALSALSFTVREGTCVGLIGPNGAGKTTAFNLISGIIKPDRGMVRFRGQSLNNLGAYERVRIGIVRSFQEMRLFMNMSVLNNVIVGASNPEVEGIARSLWGGRKVRREQVRAQARAYALIESFGMEEQANMPVANLSHAEQKLVMVIRLLATGAECLLLDEPCSGLDKNSRQVILDVIHTLVGMGRTVVLIEHNLDVVRDVCSRVVFLHQGSNLMEGTLDDVTSNEKLGAIYFGTYD
jgi:ABC-type branched-subunit amino acid transport system ATPase component